MKIAATTSLVILDVLKRTPAEAQAAAPAVWATVAHFLPELTDEQSALVVSLILDICPNCLAASRTCECWEDD
jgi:hypothetical protein